MSDQLIQIKNLSFAYEEHNNILDDISIDINEGEFVGIIGPNGAGKSTLIKIIAGLLQSNQAKITLNGTHISDYKPKQLAQILGYVPQKVEIPFSFTVHQVVEMGRFPYLQGIFHQDVDTGQEVDKAMQRMDLIEMQNRSFSTLSGGEQQRAIISSVLAQQARLMILISSVLAQQARLMILDEPTSALDLKHQQGIYRILKRLADEEGKTIVIVTHDINLAAQFCERLILMDKGKIIADGPPDQVLQFQLIQQVYGVKVYIDVNPLTKSLYILPLYVFTSLERASLSPFFAFSTRIVSSKNQAFSIRLFELL
ncbi:MAG: heme ABC transporter ATP-binding protein [Calditrichaceae bacterium]